MGIAPPGPGKSRSSAASTATPFSPTIVASRSTPARICSGAIRAMSLTPAALSVSRSFFACGSSGMIGRHATHRFRAALTPQAGDQGLDGGNRTEIRGRDLALGNLDAEFRLDREHQADHVERREAG